MQAQDKMLNVNEQNSSNPNMQLVATMVKLGISLHTAKCLVCLHVHGPSTSRNLQDNCKIRQPDVSVAIAELRRLKVVEIDSTTIAGRGRPSHVYQLTGTIEQSIEPFIDEAQDRITSIIAAITKLENLAHAKKISIRAE